MTGWEEKSSHKIMNCEIGDLIKYGFLVETGKIKEHSFDFLTYGVDMNKIPTDIIDTLRRYVKRVDIPRPQCGPFTDIFHCEIQTGNAKDVVPKLIDELSKDYVVTMYSQVGYRYIDLSICDQNHEWFFRSDAQNAAWAQARSHVIYIELDEVIDDKKPFRIGLKIRSPSSSDDSRKVAESIAEYLAGVEAGVGRHHNGSVDAAMRRESMHFVREARRRIAKRRKNNHE